MASAQPFKLASPDLKPNGTIADEQVFNGFGCSGKNVSPALSWSGAPKGTKSFALLVHDPDTVPALRAARGIRVWRSSRGAPVDDGSL